MEYTEEQLKKATEETLSDIACCCDNWNFIRDGYKANGICPDCGRAYHINDMYWSEIYGEYICNSCLDEYYGQCECCGEMFKLEDLVKDDNGCVYCESCYSDIA